MRVHQAQGKLTHHFKTGQSSSQLVLRQTQQGHGGFKRRHGCPGGQLCCWQGVELQGGCGDDAQRAFAADEQVAQVVACVVFAQGAQAVPDIAFGGDHFESQAQFACIAKTQHLGTPGVAAQIAADSARTFGRQTQGEQQLCLQGPLLQRLQNAAGLGREGQIGGIQFAHGVHALQAQDNLPARVVRGRADHQAGVAALGHDGQTAGRVFTQEAGAGFNNGCHLRRIRRTQHGQRLAQAAFAPVLRPDAQVAAG
ncbi:hypothetical protein GALL_472540 [mine drainage metagenome]|uniref:Uncharacterized protein n=1 Tax=mine drainage metagenome TaxID=410659 RepID=A0A1J5PIV9_9ZZZZ